MIFVRVSGKARSSRDFDSLITALQYVWPLSRRPTILRKLFLISCLGLPILVVARIIHVDIQFNNQPFEETIYSDGGYVPSGVYGHGDLLVDGGELSWIIFDEMVENDRIQKTCLNGTFPDPSVDVDFVFHDGLWYKLRSGRGIIRADEFTSDPKNHLWGGWLKSPVTFPVKNPPIAYQVKILRDKFFGRGTSPRQYLQFLKKSNPSCFNIPEP